MNQIALGTFIIPVYNAENYLHEAIESILNQTNPNYIVIFVDDGSTDNSIKIIESYNDDRFKVIRNEMNLGIEDTLNKALSLVETKYALRMDADDMIPENRYEVQINFMESNPDIDISSGHLKCFGNDDSIWKVPLTDNEIKAKMIFTPGLTHAACIFKMDSLKKESEFYYSKKFNHLEDYDLWIRLIDKMKFANVDQVLYYYRREGQNKTTQDKEKRNEVLLDFYKERVFPIFNIHEKYIHHHMVLSGYHIKDLSNEEFKEQIDYSKNLVKKIQNKFNVNYNEYIHSKIKKLIFIKLDQLSVMKRMKFLINNRIKNLKYYYYSIRVN